MIPWDFNIYNRYPILLKSDEKPFVAIFYGVRALGYNMSQRPQLPSSTRKFGQGANSIRFGTGAVNENV